MEHKLVDRRQDWKLDVLSALVLANLCLVGPGIATFDLVGPIIMTFDLAGRPGIRPLTLLDPLL